MSIPSAILTSQGDVLQTIPIKKVTRENRTLRIHHTDGTTTDYEYSDEGGAISDHSAFATALGAVKIGSPTLTWSSLSPATGTTSTTYVGTVLGGGFLLVGVGLEMQFNDGVGDVSICIVGVGGDTVILVNAPFSVAGTYTLYYSLNGGGWISTGLTLVVS